MSDETGTPIDLIIEDHLDTVTAKRTTDNYHRARYQFDFVINGEEIGFEISNKVQKWYSWKRLRNRLSNRTDIDIAPPARDGGDEWRRFIIDIANNGEKETFTGERTIAVNRLREEIEQRTGYTTLTDAVKQDGVFIDDSAGHLWIDRDVVRDIWENAENGESGPLNDWYGFTVGAELSARGYVADHEGEYQFTRDEQVDGRYTPLWVMDGDFAEPAEVIGNE
jgi:hypothetical protein